MLAKEQLKGLFPGGKEVRAQEPGANCVYLPLSEGTWWALPRQSLSERESYLLSAFLDQEPQPQGHPWLSYLQGQAGPPAQIQHLQALHAHIWSQSDQEGLVGWLDMMASLLPNRVATIPVGTKDYIFLLEQATFLEVKEVLETTLAVMELDFGLRLTLFIGQLWPQTAMSSWPKLIQAERSLFAGWRERYNQVCVLSLAQLYLATGQGHQILESQLTNLIQEQEMAGVITALWQEGAVLTKAAQTLYIHRNTLQYRLEKWQAWTGLQLKELTDLALCYMVLMRQEGRQTS